MAKLFQTHPETVKDLLIEINGRKLALPEFQRDFIWEPEKTASLLSSLMARYPAGSLLLWRPQVVDIEVRNVADAPSLPDPLEPGYPARLVLDGQQRLTALFRALKGLTEETYFVCLDAFIDTVDFRLKDPDEIDWDAAVEARELTGAERRALGKGGEPAHGALSWQLEHWRFPIGRVRFDRWTDGLLDAVDEADERLRRRDVLRDFESAYLSQLTDYEFPVTTLTDEASLIAVCSVFEKLNTNAVPLGPFEVLTAKFYKSGTRLRRLWDQARESHSVLRDPETDKDQGGFAVDPYTVLQVVSLRVHESPQKRIVTKKLTAGDVEAHWDDAVLALRRVIEHLRDTEGVIHRDLLPYRAILVPLAGAWLERSKLPPQKHGAALTKITRYFWASVFTTNFDQGGASQAEKDYGDLVAWLSDETRPAHEGNGEVPRVPEAVSDLSIAAETILGATVKKTALLKGLMALTIRAGARDFHKGQRLTQAVYIEDKVNSHHLFPKRRLSDGNPATGIDPQGFNAELILNRALIDAKTNGRILAKKPSAYVASMREEDEDADAVLASHLIDAESLASDDYRRFLVRRLAIVCKEIKEVTGKEVLPLVTPDNNPSGVGA